MSGLRFAAWKNFKFIQTIKMQIKTLHLYEDFMNLRHNFISNKAYLNNF